MSSENIDVVIIGGGVAGLAAATSFARTGLEVILLEQNNEFGKLIRGEVINRSAIIFKELFGAEGLPKSCIEVTYKAGDYYTPSTLKYAHRILPSGEKVGINYRKLIDELVYLASRENVNLQLNSKVIELIEKNTKINGLKYQKFDEETEIFPKLIIGAMGFHTDLSIPSNLKPPKAVCPALKIIVENMEIPDAGVLEFFFLEIPALIWIFPKSQTRAELGIMIWKDLIESPSEINLNKLLDEKIRTHPILKERLAHGNYIYYAPEMLAFGGPVMTTYIPNLFFIGDVMGHVGAVGGSGIVSSLTTGYDLGQFLGKVLNEKGELATGDFQEAQQIINKSEIGKWLKKEQSSATAMRKILYEPLKSPEAIDEMWDKFKGFIESRGAG